MAKQVPRFAITCNLPVTEAEAFDAARLRLGLTRNAFVMRCIETALPLLIGETGYRQPAEGQQPGKPPQG